jgi:hypothetical protein
MTNDRYSTVGKIKPRMKKPKLPWNYSTEPEWLSVTKNDKWLVKYKDYLGKCAEGNFVDDTDHRKLDAVIRLEKKFLIEMAKLYLGFNKDVTEIYNEGETE